MAEFPAPKEGIVLTHFIVSSDVERSRLFYTDVLGGETVRAGEPSFVQLANSWIIINVGGGPTEDKPTVTLETLPTGPDERVSQHPRRGHRIGLRRVERAWGGLHHAAARPRSRDPLLHPGSGWSPDRSRSDESGLLGDEVGGRHSAAGASVRPAVPAM
jgi:catechol 2,3-dioxygenase-like lactoylglutathione lyase family enzyme